MVIEPSYYVVYCNSSETLTLFGWLEYLLSNNGCSKYYKSLEFMKRNKKIWGKFKNGNLNKVPESKEAQVHLVVNKYTMKTIMVSFHAIPATHMALINQLPSITSLWVLKIFKLMLIIFELQVVLVLIIWFLTWKNIKNYSNWYAPSPNLKTILLQAHLVQCLWLSADQNLQADYYHLVHSYIVVKCFLGSILH